MSVFLPVCHNLPLIPGDCDLDARNQDNETPLMKAAYYDYGEIARILLKNGKHTFLLTAKMSLEIYVF